MIKSSRDFSAIKGGLYSHVHLIRKFQEHPIQTQLVTWLTNQTEAFSAIKGHNPKINDPIWTVFKLEQEFIHVICKFQEEPIKTE